MPIQGKPNLGENFYPKLVQISSELNMKPEDLLAVMISESGLNPSAYEKKYKGSGLIGFMPNTLKGLGFKGTWEDFTKLSGEQQLDYVKKVVQGNMKLNGGPFTSAGQYYVANLWPVGLKLPGVRNGDVNTPILEANPERVGDFSKKYLDVGSKILADFESKAYHANPLFDKDKKGSITLGDMIKQTDINKQNPIYQKAVIEMKKTTGYQPGKNITPQNISTDNSVNNVLEKYIQMISSANNQISIKKIYKKALSTHNILIEINSDNYNTSIEFSRILCAALDEELLSNSYPHTDGHLVEVECSIAGPAKECFEAVKQMTEVIADTFKDAIIKIGNINIQTKCIMNKKSYYQPISAKMAENNYRKFLLKFI